MGIHDGPELNRPILEFTLDPDKEPFPIAVYKVSDETYPSYMVMSDGSVRINADGTGVPAASTAIADLVDSTTGTADGTVDDVGAAFSQATLNNNFKELVVKVNAILDNLQARGLA